MSNNTGGPAFPVVYDDEKADVRHVYGGMTLRDYFAAKAMQGMVTTTEKFNMEEGRKATSPEDFARLAYLYADAMLKARQV